MFKYLISFRYKFIGTIARILCLLIFLSVVKVSFAQKSESSEKNIIGYVKDATSGESLPYANVVLKGTKFGVAANSNGYFVLVNAPVGICTLQVRYIGYAKREMVIDNTWDEHEPLLIKMTVAPIQLQAVEVTETAQMMVVSNEVSQVTVSPRRLSSLPNFGEVDIFRSLQLLPGINGANDGSSGLYIRGGTPDQNLILFDGMTIYHVDHFFGFFSAFNADAIKDIQIYKGGFPAEYGGRISSVVNLTGKTGDVNKFRYGVGANLLGGHTVIEVPLFRRGAFLLSARRSYTDYIQSSLYDKIYGFLTGGQGSGRTGSNVQLRQGRFGFNRNVASGTVKPNFYFYDLNSKLTVSPTRKDIVTVSVYNGQDNLNKSQDFGNTVFQRAGLFEGATLKTTDVTEWGNLGISGKWSRQWNDRFYSHFWVARSSYFSNYDRHSGFQNGVSQNDSLNFARRFATATNEDNKVQDMTLRIDNEWQVAKSHRLTIGSTLSQFDARYRSALNDTTELLNRKSDAVVNALYLQDKWRVWQPLEFIFGLRGTYYDATKTKYFEPRFSSTYQLTDRINLKGAWGYYYQFVNRIVNENVLEGSRDFWLLADNQLKPGFAEHQILGVSYENQDYLFDVEAYRKNIKDLIQFSRRYNALANYNNRFFTGTGTAKGIEFLIQKKSGMLTGWIGYTLGRVENQFPLLNKGETFPADYDHTHDLKIVGTVSKNRWNFSATWIYATGNAYTSLESQYFIRLLDNRVVSYIHVSGKNANRLPAYQRLDLSISRRFEIKSSNLDIGFSAFNVYNHKNVWYKQYNLDANPMVVTDIVMLGFTPTLYVQLYSR